MATYEPRMAQRSYNAVAQAQWGGDAILSR